MQRHFDAYGKRLERDGRARRAEIWIAASLEGKRLLVGFDAFVNPAGPAAGGSLEARMNQTMAKMAKRAGL